MNCYGVLNGVNGVKTGFTNNAGRCLVTSINRNGMNVICVVLGADTKKIRTTDSVKLIEYVYKNYGLVNIEEKTNEEFEKWKRINMNRIIVDKSTGENVDLKIQFEDKKIRAIKNTQVDNITYEINVLTRLKAPVEENDVIGNIVVKNGDKILNVIEIKMCKTIEKKDMFCYFKIFINNLVHGNVYKL